jgi:uncharacterized membrane protein
MVTEALFWLLVPFSFIAALMAFLITYEEMQHHYSGKKQPVREAARTAVLVLIVFLTLSWIVAILMPGHL